MTDQWLIWCGTNAEQDAIERALGNECVSIHGRTTPEEKLRMEEDWRTGRVPHLVTKPSVFGWGMNWQHCHKMIFVGLSDSYEEYFQCIRRCWRFGQSSPVDVAIVLADVEADVINNVLRKERDAKRMSQELIAHVAEYEMNELRASARTVDPLAPTRRLSLPSWLATDGDLKGVTQ